MTLLYVATTIVSTLIASHTNVLHADALGSFALPTAQEGRAIPAVFGTVMLKGGNTVWWGDLRSHGYKAGSTVGLIVGDVIGAVLTGVIGLGLELLSWFSRPVIGFQYFLGVQFALCQGPVDALVGIQADVKGLTYTPTTILNGNGTENYIELAVNSPKLFGGTVPGGGGGIVGEIRFYRGLQTQQPDDYLTAKQNRVVTDQSGMGYTFSGAGNGTLTSLVAGAAALNETITITAAGIDTNPAHSTYQKSKFNVVGSISGTIINSVANAEGSNSCWADQPFSGHPDRIDFIINTGSTQFAIGDVFTVKTLHSHLSPAYRGLCQAVFKQLYVGTSSYLKPMAFVVQRCPDGLGLGPSIANINGDANPALAIYDALTNIDWGLGVPPARIDPVSFTAAATTLATEGLGVSMQFDTQETADNLIGEILRHADGLLYTDPATGLWTLKLARADYVASSLPILTVDNVDLVRGYSRGSWQETTNSLALTFLSRLNNFNQRVVRAYDPANISVTNEVRPQTIAFLGISSEAAAGLIATRTLKTLTYPLAKITIEANRAAWSFRPGGVFKLTWVPLGIANQIFRITRIAYGELTDGKITIDAVEDIFGIEDTAFVAPPVSGWANPLGAPVAPAAEELVEAPYQMVSAAGLAEGIYSIALCARGDGTSKSYQVWLNEGAGDFLSNQIFGFAPVGLLAAIYPAATPATDPTGFSLTVAGDVDLSFLGSANSAADLPNGVNLLLIDQEIMSWQTVTANSDGTFTISGIMRGVMDTVPADHAAGATAWFFTEGAGLAKTIPYAADTTVEAKLLPENNFGTFPITSASYITLTTNSRFARPYPPGDLCMQSLGYGARYTKVYGGITLTWKSRNRLTQTAGATLIKQDAGDITPEAGTTYTAKVLLNGTLARTVTGISSETWTYTGAMRVADDPDGTKIVTIEIFSNANSLDSFMPNAISNVLMTGFGEDFGNFFGGMQS